VIFVFVFLTPYQHGFVDKVLFRLGFDFFKAQRAGVAERWPLPPGARGTRKTPEPWKENGGLLQPTIG